MHILKYVYRIQQMFLDLTPIHSLSFNGLSATSNVKVKVAVRLKGFIEIALEFHIEF